MSSSFLCLLFCSGLSRLEEALLHRGGQRALLSLGAQMPATSGSALPEAVSTPRAIEVMHGINHPKVMGVGAEAAALVRSIDTFDEHWVVREIWSKCQDQMSRIHVKF